MPSAQAVLPIWLSNVIYVHCNHAANVSVADVIYYCSLCSSAMIKSIIYCCLQCFDAVGWAAGRASSL